MENDIDSNTTFPGFMVFKPCGCAINAYHIAIP